MFVLQNNGPASDPCILQPGDDRLAVCAAGPAGCSVSRADPRGFAPWTLITLETWDAARLEGEVPLASVRPTHGAILPVRRCQVSLVIPLATKEKIMSEIKEAPKPKTQNGPGQAKDIAPARRPRR